MPITIPKKPKGTLLIPPKPVARACKGCEHVYMQPCDGENETCPNLLHLIAKGKRS